MASSEETDFLDIVQGYLDRGEVYKNADEFVTKLALCPRCRGGKSQNQVLKETLFRMVTLVKEKLEGQRNKKILQAWLKTVAKALDTFEVISRNWISENVWKLPNLPKLKEQDYDPTKGRRDIRFFPETETKLLDVTEQEMEVELDYIDEDKLLSVSPTKTSTGSPRKSPRSSKLQPQQESISPAKSSVGSPRRSPRFSEAEIQEESSRKEVASSARVSDSAVTCSPPRKALLQIAPVVPKGLTKDSTQSKGLVKVGKKASSKEMVSGVTRRDTQPKPARSAKPADSKEWRQQGDRGACSSSTPAVAESVGDMEVSATSVGRTVQIREKDIRKRGASGHSEEMVISATFLKKTKTDDLISQVRQKVEERRDTQVKKPEKVVVRCWVPGCGGAAKYLKAHAFYDHLPSIFDERFDPSDEKIMRIRRNALKQAGRWLLGRPVELDELVAFVIVQKLLSQADNTAITKRQERAMQEFCKFLQEPIPDKFILEPCNSVGGLLHWKALLLIAASLTEEERGYWRTTFQAPEDAELQDVQPAQQQKVFPEAFDSHFHLDRTLHEMFLPAQGTLDDILQQAPVDEDKKISLVGAVAIYCDPRTFPSEDYLDQMPENISVGIGFHPKQAKSSVARINEEVRQLRRLLRHPRVVAFGEVGLDHSDPPKYWAFQIELLEKVLPFLEDRHVLVIHCRGMQGDCGTEAFLLLLYYLKKYVRPHQQLHLHCFTGNSYVLERWLEVFPRTYFGFTNKVRSFNRHQITALCQIDENRLLLESDAPYFPIEGTTVSSPGHLNVLAETVAAHRQLTVERVLEITVTNARHLYQGQQ